MTSYLLVAHQTADSPDLRARVAEITGGERDATFSVLVPATAVNHLLTWNEGEAVETATANSERAARMLEEAGAKVQRVSIGSGSPLAAIQDDLRAHPETDVIIVSTFPGGMSHWLGLDLVTQTRRKTGLPVIHVVSRQRTGRSPAAASSPAAAANPARPPEILPLPPREYEARLPEASDAATHLKRLLSNNASVLAAYQALERTVELESGLTPEMQQAVRLRVAIHLRSEYLWHDAVRRSRALGVADDRIFAVEHWYASDRVRFSETERAVLRFVDAVSQHQHISDATFGLVTGHLTAPAVVGLLTVINLARSTALFADTTGLSTEERFVGWEGF